MESSRTLGEKTTSVPQRSDLPEGHLLRVHGQELGINIFTVAELSSPLLSPHKLEIVYCLNLTSTGQVQSKGSGHGRKHL